MVKKLKCWRKSSVGWEYQGGGWIYVYPKGKFRDKEEQVVISTSLTGGSNSQDRKNTGFETKSKALRFAKSFMRKHDKC